VISLVRGTQISISATDQAQITTPAARTTSDARRRAAGGPPTPKKEGDATFRIRPITRNGRVNSPILSPLPTSALRLAGAERSVRTLLMARVDRWPAETG